jgi:hypothetical protein
MKIQKEERKKKRKKEKRKDKGNRAMGIHLAHAQSHVCWVGWICCDSHPYVGIFLLDANMKSVPPFHLLLFSLHESLLELLSFRLPLFPPASPARSVSICVSVTRCRYGASG